MKHFSTLNEYSAPKAAVYSRLKIRLEIISLYKMNSDTLYEYTYQQKTHKKNSSNLQSTRFLLTQKASCTIINMNKWKNINMVKNWDDGIFSMMKDYGIETLRKWVVE